VLSQLLTGHVIHIKQTIIIICSASVFQASCVNLPRWNQDKPNCSGINGSLVSTQQVPQMSTGRHLLSTS